MGPRWRCSLSLLGIRLVAYGHLASLSLLSTSSTIHPPTEQPTHSLTVLSSPVKSSVASNSEVRTVNASLWSTTGDDTSMRQPERANGPASPTPLTNEGNQCRDNTQDPGGLQTSHLCFPYGWLYLLLFHLWPLLHIYITTGACRPSGRE